MKRFIKFLHIKNTRPIRGIWLPALCIFAFALFPTFATAENNCGGTLTQFAAAQKPADDEFIYANQTIYEKAKTATAGQNWFNTSYNTRATLAAESNEVFECDNSACKNKSLLLMDKEHIYEGKEITEISLYICSSPTIGNDKWEPLILSTDANCTGFQVGTFYGNLGDEYDLYSLENTGYCIKKKNSTSSTSQSNDDNEFIGSPLPANFTPQNDTPETVETEPTPAKSEPVPPTPVSTETEITVTGRVVDSETSEAVAFAMVQETNNPQNCNVLTDKNGDFRLICRDISEIEITLMGYKPLKKSIENTSKNTVSLGTLKMERERKELEAAVITENSRCKVSIRVTGKNNAPISGATVKHGEETYTTDENGSATIRGIQTHTEFQINISHTDYKFTTYSGGPMDSCPDEPVVISLSAAGDDDTPPSPPQNNGDDNNNPDPTEPDADLESQRQIDQARIDELQENADAMREREQSLANRMIGGASMGAMGIGGMQVASALAEQSADDAAELDMTAYLATFRCDYGAGQNIRGGETNITLPGANILLPLYNEYTTLAADLKSRKESLGMAPGIESETILDATLYDNESIGITDGAYTSLSRALSNPTGADAAEWAAQRAETAEQLKTGAIVAGVGAAVGIAGNILTNYVGDQPRERSAEINAKYDALRDELRAKLKPIERESETAAIQTAPEIESGKENTPEVKPTPPQPSAAETACTQNGGTWANNTCDCGTGKTWKPQTMKCEVDEIIKDEPYVAPEPRDPILTLYNGTMFESGGTEIINTDTLDETIKILKGHVDTTSDFKLVLAAHTDRDTINPNGTLPAKGIHSNEDLARARGNAVKNYIKKQWGISDDKIVVIAIGAECATATTKEGKAKERKVNFYLFFDGENPNNIDRCPTSTSDIRSPPPPAGA